MGLDRLLMRLPRPLQKGVREAVAWVPPSCRQSRIYRHWRGFLVQAQHWPAERIQQWQLEKLRRIIQHAITQTEGYRELYRRAGVGPEDVHSLSDLKLLPFTTKELFRDNLAAFTIPNHHGRYTTTGGSTGIPLGFYEHPDMSHIERAFMHTGWGWAGWQLGQPSAVLRGGFVGTETAFSHFDRFNRELAFSSYFLTERTLAAYLERFRSSGIRILQAYPSSLNLLCGLMKEKRLEGKIPLELILLGSENVYDWQLARFSECFPQARLFAWYGHSERAVLAPWCEHTRQFHVWPFYGLAEVIGPDEGAVPEGEEGEIVATSLQQEITPIIRYRTMDRAVKGPAACSRCRRQFPILSRIAGRSHEVIMTRTGRFISMTAINMHDDIFEPLRQFQFRQDTRGEVTFRYVAKDVGLSELALAKIRQGLMVKLGTDMKLNLEQVSEIPRTKAGKFQFLDQHLRIEYGDS